VLLKGSFGCSYKVSRKARYRLLVTVKLAGARGGAGARMDQGSVRGGQGGYCVDDTVTTTYQYRQSGKHADQKEEAGLATRLGMLDTLEMSELCFYTPQQAAEITCLFIEEILW
jgi:hypothetical protein